MNDQFSAMLTLIIMGCLLFTFLEWWARRWWD